MATLLLRDIPKHRVQLDHLVFQVDSGFRGFANLLPGFHLVRVFADADDHSAPLYAELILERPASVAVLIADGGKLIPDVSEGGKRLADMAAQGTMNAALINVLARYKRKLADWHAVTSAIDCPLAELPAPESGYAEGFSRFERFWLQNGCDPQRTLRTVQTTCVRATCLDDADAVTQLRGLLQAHYHASEHGVELASHYLPLFVDWLQSAAKWNPTLFAKGSAGREGLANLLEDLRDVGQEKGRPALVKSAEKLAKLLASLSKSSAKTSEP